MNWGKLRDRGRSLEIGQDVLTKFKNANNALGIWTISRIKQGMD